MSHYYKLLIVAGLLFAFPVIAVDFFADALYWRATESIDWCYNNSLTTPTQTIDYQSVNFNYKPAFRVGITNHGRFDNAFSYTRYYTSTNASASGNLVTTFIGGKFALNGTFANAGHVNFKIDFNMFDWDLSQTLQAAESLQIRPVIGLRGGWINQKVVTDFQGPVTFTENVKNNFKGIGPKCALESKWLLHHGNDARLSLIGLFTASYLWGNWNISDIVTEPTGITFNTSVGKRNFGALAIQGLLGLELNYKKIGLKFSYEIADWFEQYQVLDDGTGARCVDLLLQGLTLGFVYRF